jgi:hypothetical protein
LLRLSARFSVQSVQQGGSKPKPVFPAHSSAKWGYVRLMNRQ